MKRHTAKDPRSRLLTGLAVAVALMQALFLLWIFARPVYGIGPDQLNIVEKQIREKNRQSGFGDIEIDNLHGKITRNLAIVVALGKIEPYPDSADVLTSQTARTAFVKGKDSDGKIWYRMRLRHGISFSSDIFPSIYLYEGHCFLYPKNPADISQGIEKLMVQFYRINYSGIEHSREIRRIVHPNPLDKAQALDKPPGADVQLLDNSDITVEMYSYPTSQRPTYVGWDGIPLPNLGVEPQDQVKLNDKANPIPYDKQFRILQAYKEVLRSVNRQLSNAAAEAELERNVKINNMIDFSTSGI
ncbi:MAG: hypothetical protein KDK37_05795 [Leptospiraceae bacterium]|nr:hypothetical protein [Leptospiraceae bacterium]MCB1303766.1 hypothetical protein [Leptospiraceae bacterium]